MRIRSTAPCRIDLAGGTLDIHPLYLLIAHACTVNLAIDLRAEVVIEPAGGESVDVNITDKGLQFRFEREQALPVPDGGELVAAIIRHFGVSGCSITTNSQAPASAGLGASSALCVALCSALAELTNRKMDRENLIQLCLDLEASVLGTPAGYQDFFASANGGLQRLSYEPGDVRASAIDVDVQGLSRHIILAYTGKPHHSGLNNWEVYKRFIDGDKVTRAALADIGNTAVETADALAESDWQSVAELVRKEWSARKRLWPGISTETIDAIVESAVAMGGAGKVCGAGGGGCVFVWHDGSEESTNRLLAGIRKHGGEVLDWRPSLQGCNVIKS